ncbi:phosphatase PAP2 family protein [Isoptericola sp. F-RaC21]|uniref:phosphatase PAP2 family protein n=1 Tax=Isoptericola sp. F-RaC21 TaxID=3141452 RepID=UPI00315B9FAD
MPDDASRDGRSAEPGTRDGPAAPPGRGVGAPLLVGAGLALGFVALYLLAVRTEVGQQLDDDALAATATLWDATVPLTRLVRAALPLLLAAVVLVPLARAVGARAWRRLAAAALVVGVSVLGSQLLKHVLLDRPDLGHQSIPENSYPSGHMAAVTALCVAVVLLWPGGASRAVVAGWSLVALVAVAVNVVSFAHRPSDVLGSLLLVGAVTAATWWGLRLGEAAPVPARGRGRARAR